MGRYFWGLDCKTGIDLWRGLSLYFLVVQTFFLSILHSFIHTLRRFVSKSKFLIRFPIQEPIIFARLKAAKNIAYYTTLCRETNYKDTSRILRSKANAELGINLFGNLKPNLSHEDILMESDPLWGPIASNSDT